MEQYFNRLFCTFGMPMPPCISHFLSVKQVIRKKRQQKKKERKTKKERKEKYFVNLRLQEQQTKKAASKRDGTYKKGQNMEEGGADGYTLDELLAAAAAKPSVKRQHVVCKHCKKAGHSTTRSKKCLLYKQAKPKLDPPESSTSTGSALALEPPADSIDDIAEHMDALATMHMSDNVDDVEEGFVDCTEAEQDALSTGSI
jgi:hypothetical protein